MKQISFAGKRVLITGAAGGLGRSLSLGMAEEGAHIIAWDLDADRLDQLKEELQKAGGTAYAYVCDVSEPDAIVRTATEVFADVGGVDILVNNAGVVSGRPFMEIPDEAVVSTFAVNTLALFRTTRVFLPGMIERGSGHIVTIASAGGIVGAPKLTDYASSKFAAFGFDDALRIEFKRMGIPVRTTVVCPFFFQTKMFAGAKSRFAWLLPILTADKIAQRTIRAVKRGRRRLILPWFVYVTFLVRLLPVPVFDWLVDFFGISRSMDGFGEGA
jgi:all-trans-retinol dehydrogenase (NAD+)